VGEWSEYFGNSFMQRKPGRGRKLIFSYSTAVPLTKALINNVLNIIEITMCSLPDTQCTVMVVGSWMMVHG
jgi:hypothetical protein